MLRFPRPSRVPPGIARLLVGCALALATGWAMAADAVVIALSGSVVAERTLPGGSTESRPLSARSEVSEGELVRTSKDGRAQLRFSDGGLVSLQPGTEFRIDTYEFGDERQEALFTLLRGALRTATGSVGKRNHDDYRLRTPTATVGIRGTEYLAEQTVCDPLCAPGPSAGLRVSVTRGLIVLATPVASLDIAAGQSAEVQRPDDAPRMTAEGPVLAPRSLNEGGSSTESEDSESGGAASGETQASNGTEADERAESSSADAQGTAGSSNPGSDDRAASSPGSDERTENSAGSGADSARPARTAARGGAAGDAADTAALAQPGTNEGTAGSTAGMPSNSGQLDAGPKALPVVFAQAPAPPVGDALAVNAGRGPQGELVAVPGHTPPPNDGGGGANPESGPGARPGPGDGGTPPNPPGAGGDPAPPGSGIAPTPPGGGVAPNPPGSGIDPTPPGGGVPPNPPSGGVDPNPPGGGVDPNPPGGGVDPNPPGGGVDPNPPGGGVDPNPPGGGVDPNPPGGDPDPPAEPEPVVVPPLVPGEIGRVGAKADVFVTGMSGGPVSSGDFPSGTTYRFQAGNRTLQSIGASCPSSNCLRPTSARVLEAQATDFAAWGRWTDGTVLRTDHSAHPIRLNKNQGIHYLVGAPSATVPTQGVFGYTLIGATRPTLSDGSIPPGDFTGSAAVAFGPAQAPRIGIEGLVTFTQGLGQPATLQFATEGGAQDPHQSSLLAGARFGFTDHALQVRAGGPALPECGNAGCTVKLNGGLFGTNAAELGFTYSIGSDRSSNRSVDGAAVFGNPVIRP